MSAEPVLTLGIFQSDAGESEPAARLRRLQKVFEDPAVRQCDLLVCPELYLSGYFADERIVHRAQAADGPFAGQVCELARRWECAIVYGYPERAADRVFNSVLVAAPDGSVTANHRKNLLPHEYEEKHFSAGRQPTVFQLRGWNIGLLICYEVEFPEAVRYHAHRGCDLVVAPTALTEHWAIVANRLIPTRAFENNIFVAYANYAGLENGNRYLGGSVIVSPHGADLVRAGDGECVITAQLQHSEIKRARGRLRYLEDVGQSCYVPGARD